MGGGFLTKKYSFEPANHNNTLPPIVNTCKCACGKVGLYILYPVSYTVGITIK